METIARKPIEVQYDYVKMDVGEYRKFCGCSEKTVYSRVEKIRQGIISREVLDFEQLAPGYPITLIVRIRKSFADVLRREARR